MKKKYGNYTLGQGKIWDGVMDVITGKNEDPIAAEMLNKIMRNPKSATKLLGIMYEDMSGKKMPRTKKKVRRGIGSY